MRNDHLSRASRSLPVQAEYNDHVCLIVVATGAQIISKVRKTLLLTQRQEGNQPTSFILTLCPCMLSIKVPLLSFLHSFEPFPPYSI
jgi:hypothetical protein